MGGSRLQPHAATCPARVGKNTSRGEGGEGKRIGDSDTDVAITRSLNIILTCAFSSTLRPFMQSQN